MASYNRHKMSRQTGSIFNSRWKWISERLYIVFTQSERGLINKSEIYIGFSYRFYKKNASQYACTSCKTLGKSRVVTVKSGRIDVRKHPDDDHHKDCRPIADVELCSQSTGESFSAALTCDKWGNGGWGIEAMDDEAMEDEALDDEAMEDEAIRQWWMRQRGNAEWVRRTIKSNTH